MIEVIKVLHCQNGKSDKIWGVLRQSNTVYVAFWGRVGRKLQFQDFPPSMFDVNEKAYEKIDKKRYREITPDELREIQEDFDSQVLMAVLGGVRPKANFTEEAPHIISKNEDEN